MPRLILKSDNRVLKDHVVGAMSTIGRRPDNTIIIDDGAGGEASGSTSEAAHVGRAGGEHGIVEAGEHRGM